MEIQAKEDMDMQKKWWHDKVAYQIYPKSFCDTNGDGIGDLRGIISKLDYLKELGVDIIWLSPIYKSPFVDQGYDISDYYAIAEEFGTMEEFDELLAEAKKRDMYLIMDLVVNHCSDKHEWFQKALADPDGPYADYFYFRKGKNGNPPSNYRSYFGGNCWEPVPGSDKYYFHMFAKEQPDLNWENPKLREEIYRMINWWLDKGLAGFRIDAIINIKKDLAFPDMDMPGVDIVIPDFTYVEGNKDKIRGIVITHGHEDHIGGLAYLLKKINVPIYGTRMTLGLIEGKLEEHGLLKQAKLIEVEPRTTVRMGCMAVEFIKVNHSIPGAVGMAIHTPAGIIVHTGDFKVDFSPIDDEIIDLARFGELGSRGVLALMADSTNAERTGFTCSERTVGGSFEKLFKISMQGTLTYKVGLGTDVFGNIQRMDNLLESMPTRQQDYKEKLKNLEIQVEIAKQEVEKPFPREEELKEKSARLDQLNILLNMDKRENEIVDGVQDEGEIQPQRESRGWDR